MNTDLKEAIRSYKMTLYMFMFAFLVFVGVIVVGVLFVGPRLVEEASRKGAYSGTMEALIDNYEQNI